MSKKFKAGNSHAGVHGKTIIDHRIRNKVNVSCNEYVIMDFIMNLFFENKEGFNPKEHDEILYKNIGCYSYQIESIVKILMDKGLLSIENETYLTTEKWDQHFNHVDVETELNELWNKFGKVGNKKKALNYYKTLKKEGITYEHIDQQMDLYLRYIELSGTFIMHLSSWLSPGFKKFDDEHYQIEVDKLTASMTGSKIESEQDLKFTI